VARASLCGLLEHVFKRRTTDSSADTNPLAAYFYRNQDGRLIHKWLHYFDIYDRHFAPFRDREITVVEFGVSHGGSLQMWRDYFGPKARIVGVDIDERCAALAGSGAEVVIGDQADPGFLRALADKVGPVDVLIEDGGHTMEQQLTTFAEMWPVVRDGGVYLVEDLHTSYWAEYGGGYRRPGTFIEYAKTLIDSVNAWHSRDPHSFVVDEYTRTVRGMHVYDSIIVFDKGNVEKPDNLKIGKPTLED
jgi:cephalosporin hydroxylase